MRDIAVQAAWSSDRTLNRVPDRAETHTGFMHHVRSLVFLSFEEWPTSYELRTTQGDVGQMITTLARRTIIFF